MKRKLKFLISHSPHLEVKGHARAKMSHTGHHGVSLDFISQQSYENWLRR